MDREFLGVTLQYADKRTIKIRTLDILELYDRHTAENLAADICKILEPYDIDLKRILTVTTDNANNMTAAVARLKTSQEKLMNGIDDEEDSDSETEDSISDQDEQEPSTSKFEKIEFVEPILNGIRCAEHTLQLAVNDTLKATKFKSILERIRAGVKALRKMPYKRMFKLSNKRRPKLDCVTRWNSTYLMLESLWKEKIFIHGLVDCKGEPIIDNSLWTFIEEYLSALKPVAEATVQLQGSQITFGDFFLIWEKCCFQINKKDDELSVTLAAKMIERRKQLMNNEAFLGAIYMDQRINFRNSPFITNEERSIAMVK